MTYFRDFKLILGKGPVFAIGAIGLGIGVVVGISYIITSNDTEEAEDILISSFLHDHNIHIFVPLLHVISQNAS